MSPRPNPRSANEWATVLPRYLGMVGLIFVAIVWLVTKDHLIEPLLVTAFIGLTAVGQGLEAWATLKQTPPVPPAPPEPAETRGAPRG